MVRECRSKEMLVLKKEGTRVALALVGGKGNRSGGG